MSTACVDAAIELSQDYRFPMVLIASRRQIEAKHYGGGYVNNWDTKSFAEYVRRRDKTGAVLLARDHGGPWQNGFEQSEKMNISRSMALSKELFETDIQCGFDCIHIDTTVPVDGERLDLDTILDRLFELYGHCSDFARQCGRSVAFELGSEEQSGYGQDLEQFEYFLDRTQTFCQKHRIRKPDFVVAQTGTKVVQTRNIGLWENARNGSCADIIQRTQDILNICSRYGIMLKEHNTDYLSDQSLALRPLIGIHAANVAPEFGVVETLSLLKLMAAFELAGERRRFIDIACESRRWEKWMAPGATATREEKTTICGHYVFSHPDVVAIRRSIRRCMANRGLDLDAYIKTTIKSAMMRYIQLFGLTKGVHRQ